MRKIYLPVVLTLAVALSGCSMNKSKGDDAMMYEDSMMEDEGADGAMMENSDAEVDPNGMDAMENADVLVELNAEPFTFGQDEVLLSQNSTVKFRITNVRGNHDFVIDELNISTGPIPEGEFVDVVIPTDQVGEFTYYCSVADHRAQGMEGTIIIE